MWSFGPGKGVPGSISKVNSSFQPRILVLKEEGFWWWKSSSSIVVVVVVVVVRESMQSRRCNDRLLCMNKSGGARLRCTGESFADMYGALLVLKETVAGAKQRRTGGQHLAAHVTRLIQQEIVKGGSPKRGWEDGPPQKKYPELSMGMGKTLRVICHL